MCPSGAYISDLPGMIWPESAAPSDPEDAALLAHLAGVRDSKTLVAGQRERLAPLIAEIGRAHV